MGGREPGMPRVADAPWAADRGSWTVDDRGGGKVKAISSSWDGRRVDGTSSHAHGGKGKAKAKAEERNTGAGRKVHRPRAFWRRLGIGETSCGARGR